MRPLTLPYTRPRLPSPRLELDSGRRVCLITREDYREGTVGRDGELISGDRVVTRQTADLKRDPRRRERTDTAARAMADALGEHARGVCGVGGGGEGGAGAGGGSMSGRGGGAGQGRGMGRGHRSGSGEGGAGRGGVIARPVAWG